LKIFYAPFYIKIYLLKYIISDLKLEPWAKSPSSMVEKLISDRLSVAASFLPEHKEIINNFLLQRIKEEIQLNLSEDDYKTLIVMFDFLKPRASNPCGFYISHLHYHLIPYNKLKYFEASKNPPLSYVHIFNNEGKFFNKDSVENHVRSLNINKMFFVHDQGTSTLLRLIGKLDLNYNNRILYVKIINEYIPYDPEIPVMQNKDIFLKVENGYKKLNIKTEKYNTKSTSVISASSKYNIGYLEDSNIR